MPSHQDSMMGGRQARPVLINSWIVPYGNYEICSSTIEIPKISRNDPLNTSILFQKNKKILWLHIIIKLIMF